MSSSFNFSGNRCSTYSVENYITYGVMKIIKTICYQLNITPNAITMLNFLIFKGSGTYFE